jgi:endonuclease-3
MKLHLQKILELLEKTYGSPRCFLKHQTPFQLLVAVVLSAQCTDARVNSVTPRLFSHYKTPEDFVNASLTHIESLIFSTGFYKTKAQRIQNISRILLEKYNGDIPHTLNDFITLPGVGRKTAQVVLQEVHNQVDGIVVDTHVLRNSYRIGFGENTRNAEKQEKILMKTVPKKYWKPFSYFMILLGRSFCTAKNPKCSQCFLNKYCEKNTKV